MFFRLIWIFLVSWLVASLLRLLAGRSRRTRAPRSSSRRGVAGAEGPATPPSSDSGSQPPPYSRADVVDAKFVEVEEEPPVTSQGP